MCMCFWQQQSTVCSNSASTSLAPESVLLTHACLKKQDGIDDKEST